MPSPLHVSQRAGTSRCTLSPGAAGQVESRIFLQNRIQALDFSPDGFTCTDWDFSFLSLTSQSAGHPPKKPTPNSAGPPRLQGSC